MKTDIKLQATPEQYEAIQKICFDNNIGWKDTGSTLVENVKYIFIGANSMTLSYQYRFFNNHSFEEVDADLFIRTNGTCEEFTCEHPGVNNTTGKCIICGEHIDKSDFETNIQSSALSSEQLKLFRAGRNFEVPQYLLNNPTKLLKELNSELVKSTKTTSVNLKPECQFAKYGFEKPDFECEIWKVETSVSFKYIHGLVLNDYAHPMGNLEYHKWNKKTGEVLVGCSSKNLTPIKNPWYETCKFPILVWDGDEGNDLLAIETRGDYASSYLEMCKPLTNDEIEGLKQ